MDIKNIMKSISSKNLLKSNSTEKRQNKIVLPKDFINMLKGQNSKITLPAITSRKSSLGTKALVSPDSKN